MKNAKPITFTPDNILGILSYAYAEGHIPYREAIKNRCPKITTRRVINPQPITQHDKGFLQYYLPGKGNSWDHPLYRSGDILYVKEPWKAPNKFDSLQPSQMKPENWLKQNGGLWYLADNQTPTTPISESGRYRHARFMPKWASRIYLSVERDSHIEPLMSITPVGAINEGFPGLTTQAKVTEYLDWFEGLWDEIHGSGAFRKNPLVWVTTFRIEKVVNHNV